MSQPKIPKNKKDPDYDPHLKKHYTATPSDTGTTEQPIVKSAPLMSTPTIISLVFFTSMMLLSFAQMAGIIDVTGFLNPKSPTYLDLNSVLSPASKNNAEELPYGEDSPDDDVGLDDSFMGRDLINNPEEDNDDKTDSINEATNTYDSTEETESKYFGNVTIDSATCRLSDRQPWAGGDHPEYVYDLEIKAHARGSVGASLFIGTNPLSGDGDAQCGEWEKTSNGYSCIRAEGNPEDVSVTSNYKEMVTSRGTNKIYLTAVLTLDPNGDTTQRIMLDIKYHTLTCP